MGAEVRKESRCPGQQEPSIHSPAVATSHTDTDAQQTTPQDEWRGSSKPASLAERDINENIPVANSPEDGDSRVGFDPTENENSASLESRNILDLAPSLVDGFDFDPADDENSTSSQNSIELATALGGDSQFDFDVADEGTPICSPLSLSILEYPEENGRTYHKMTEGRYPFPNDPAEQDRLDLQHQLFLLTQNQKLLNCPADPSKLHRVLDLGTGTGIWVMDFGDENPQSYVLGVDLSPIQPDLVPPNVSFCVDDIEAMVIFSLCSPYHLVTNFLVVI
jgi:hypothetical protein